MTKNNVHLIEDKSLGGLKREYIEVDRKADVEDYVFKDGIIREVIERYYEDISRGVTFEPYAAFQGDDETYGWADGYYMTLEPTDIVVIEGNRYRLVDRKAEVGEKVVISKGERNFEGNGDYRTGGIFTVTRICSDSIYVNGKFSDKSPINLFRSRDEYRVLVPVESNAETVEATTVDTSEASPSVIEMLGNLAQRIVELEKTVAELSVVNARLLDEIDTLHSNQKRLGEELANGLSSINTKTPFDADEVIVELAKLLVEATQANMRKEGV